MGISARPAWRKATMVAGLLILVLLGGLAAAVLWQLARDPLAALPRIAGEPDLVTVGRQRAAGREWRRVVLQIEGGGEVALQISLPDPLPARPLPVVLVLGGLGDGAESVRSMPAAGGNVLVGYDWPVPRRVPRELSALPTLLGIPRRLLLVPGEVSAALRWITAQPWADAERISLVGLSLGALAAPAVQRVAATQGVAIGWTVLGYGGAPLGALLTHHP